MLSHKPLPSTPRSIHDLHEYFRTLSDSARLRILDYLAASPEDLKVSDLARGVRMSQPLCSWHLRRLARVQLVKIRRVGREARCSLNRARLAAYERAFAEAIAARYARAERKRKPK